jgi:DNA-directed RNA polymerase specialized sigma24 family protein
MLSREETMIEAAQLDRESAWKALLGLYEQRIFSFIRKRVSDEHIAQDLTQDVFFDAFQGIGELRGPNVIGWLYRIARNKVSDHYRGRLRAPKLVGCASEILAQASAKDDRSSSLPSIDEIAMIVDTRLPKHGRIPKRARLLANMFQESGGNVTQEDWEALARHLLETEDCIPPARQTQEMVTDKIDALLQGFRDHQRSPSFQKAAEDLNYHPTRRQVLAGIGTFASILGLGGLAEAFQIARPDALFAEEAEERLVEVGRLRTVSASIEGCKEKLAPVLWRCAKQFFDRKTDENARLAFEAADRAVALSLDAMDGGSGVWLRFMREAVESIRAGRQAFELRYQYRRAQIAHYTGNRRKALDIAREISTAEQARRFTVRDEGWRIANARFQAVLAGILVTNGYPEEAATKLSARKPILNGYGTEGVRRLDGILLMLRAEADPRCASEQAQILEQAFQQMSDLRLLRLQLGPRLLRCRLLAGQGDEAIALQDSLIRDAIDSGYHQCFYRLDEAYAGISTKARDKCVWRRRLATSVLPASSVTVPL